MTSLMSEDAYRWDSWWPPSAFYRGRRCADACRRASRRRNEASIMIGADGEQEMN
jgi:hypothetical protein